MPRISSSFANSSSQLVLHAGRGDGDGQQQPQGVDNEIAFAPLDLFAGVEAGQAALRDAAGALRVNDGGRRLGVAAHAGAPRPP